MRETDRKVLGVSSPSGRKIRKLGSGLRRFRRVVGKHRQRGNETAREMKTVGRSTKRCNVMQRLR